MIALLKVERKTHFYILSKKEGVDKAKSENVFSFPFARNCYCNYCSVLARPIIKSVSPKIKARLDLFSIFRWK